jgi:hypothetical protein
VSVGLKSRQRPYDMSLDPKDPDGLTLPDTQTAGPAAGSKGVHAAALAGRLHRLTHGITFAGYRTERLDLLRRITGLIDGPLWRSAGTRRGPRPAGSSQRGHDQATLASGCTYRPDLIGAAADGDQVGTHARSAGIWSRPRLRCT